VTTTRELYPPGVPCFVDATQPDTAAATDFYGAVLGWKFTQQHESYFAARLPAGEVAAIGGGDTPRWNTYVAVDDAEAALERVQEAGGSVTIPVHPLPGVGRMAELTDPAGAVLRVWEAEGFAGSQVVNEPGAWNWSNLHARDVEGAEHFYGAVFGWKVREVELAPGLNGRMITVPGYGEHLEQLDPGVHERHAGAGAPEGFTDAIGWIEPLENGAAAHWHVTFSAADADATVARAAERGAEVLVPPFDAGPVRMATLRDPQGAVFSVSTYTPPA
jgi:predicted enzyme related to lactoylglutathione lyase